MLRVGLGRQIELQVGHTLWNRLDTRGTDGTRRETGVGDLSLGVKAARAATASWPALVVAGSVALPVYEHWGPIKSFLTGESNKVPTFLDILPDKDRVVIHLEPR